MAEKSALLVNLHWLIRLRTWAIGGQLCTLLLAHFALDVHLRWVPLGLLLGLEALSNVIAAAAARRQRAHPMGLVALVAFDVLALTGLLALTGGPSNPFNFLYLINLTLAALMLPPKATWSLTVLATVCFGALFLVPQAPGAPDPHAMHGMHGMEGQGEMDLHVRGMWVAFAVAASFIVYFVGRLTRALARQEAELVRARERETRGERLAALAGLAAGAAHELATPLGTVAVAAGELERALGRARPSEELLADVQLIRQQVARCRDILHRMNLDAGQLGGEAPQALTAGALVAETLGLRTDRERFVISGGAIHQPLRVFRLALVEALRSVLDNAARAAPDAIEVHIEARGDAVCFTVRDRGPGMPPEVLDRIGEPFFTTRDPGVGMGLGLFLARSILERHRGALRVTCPPGGGTSVELEVRSVD